MNVFRLQADIIKSQDIAKPKRWRVDQKDGDTAFINENGTSIWVIPAKYLLLNAMKFQEQKILDAITKDAPERLITYMCDKKINDIDCHIFDAEDGEVAIDKKLLKYIKDIKVYRICQAKKNNPVFIYDSLDNIIQVVMPIKY